jgi:hypothetical protein
MTAVRIPVGARIFLLDIVSRPVVVPIQWVLGARFPAVKRMGREIAQLSFI